MDDSRKNKTTDMQTSTESGKAKEEGEPNNMRKKNSLAEDAEEFEAGAEEQEQATGVGELEALKEELEAARKKAADSYDLLLRSTADFENYKKRAQRQAEEHRKFANESLIRDLLVVIDNLERALNASTQRQANDESCMIEGIEMTLQEIFKILKRYDVSPVEAQGKPFDPTYHEAVMQEPSERYPENTVTNELQKGYLLHDRLIRPAMVVVSKGRPSDADA